MVDGIKPTGTPVTRPTPALASAPAPAEAPPAPATDVLVLGVTDARPGFLTGREATPRIDQPTADALQAARAEAAALKGPAAATAKALGADADFEQALAAVAGDPLAEAALMRFTRNEAQPPEQRKRALAALADLAGQAVAPGLVHVQLVREVVREIADPGTINQRANDTCAPTTVQIVTAMTKPAFYVDTIAALAKASDPAEAPLLGPGKLVREPGSADTEAAEARGDRRTQSSRLFQSAAMELGNGELDYDLAADVSTDLTTGAKAPGLNSAQHAALQTQVLGRATRDALPVASAPTADFMRFLTNEITDAQIQAIGRKEIAKGVEAALKDGPVAVGMDWPVGDGSGAEARHKVVVVAMDAERVTLHNPQGFIDHLTRAEFERRLANATLPTPGT